ncbi:putative peptidoglycan lipid II flippase [Propionibacterium cyclohexanicum]|uniref:Putative peptidoglycan lipid II flippase n=1 Tax=Propionibacterium cyclohexanicum TaxID=64702 RepID=A0A1H9RQI8_9ACTN|nr:hypothetical protein [Propionibacterium cyclohexanicum]SER74854.1 putative peptidoglycan lipid II flippase [Propionibacterium cyclohexanicum]
MERTTADPVLGGSSESGPATMSASLLAGRYRLEHELHVHHGAVSWQAFDDVLSRRVVAHVLEPGSDHTAGVLAAARASALATDSRFLRVLDAMDGDTPFVICEAVTGVSLRELLSHGPLTALEAAHIVREIADALVPLHSQGVFHRRIDPQTVTITRSGNVKISGFLIDAALGSSAPGPPPSWREQEASDVRALGKLLYASLVARWPIDLDLEQTRQWGLLAAPLTSPAVSGERRWVPPASLSARVSAPLDAICMEILCPRPGGEALRSVEQIDTALGRVLGNAAADDQLEHRVALLLGDRSAPDRLGDEAFGSWPTPAPLAMGETTSAITTAQPARDVTLAAPATSLAPATAIVERGPAEPSRSVSHPRTSSAPASPPARRPPQSSVQRVGAPANRLSGRPGGWHPDPQPGTPRISPGRDRPQTEPSRAYRLGRWLIPLFVILMLVVSVSGMLRSCESSLSGWPGTGSHGRSTSTAARSDIPLAGAPKSVVEFDPVADGGEGKESPAEVPLATDGNPSTAWHTQEYWNSALMGGLKPGTGLMLDFGAVSTVDAVKLTLVGEPTGVQIRVPADDAHPSMATVRDWKVVADDASAPQTVTLSPSTPVTTQHLLVYITSLPKLANGHFQAGIAEIKVNP